MAWFGRKTVDDRVRGSGAISSANLAIYGRWTFDSSDPAGTEVATALYTAGVSAAKDPAAFISLIASVVSPSDGWAYVGGVDLIQESLSGAASIPEFLAMLDDALTVLRAERWPWGRLKLYMRLRWEATHPGEPW